MRLLILAALLSTASSASTPPLHADFATDLQASRQFSGADSEGDAQFTEHISLSPTFRKDIFHALDVDPDGQFHAEPFQALETQPPPLASNRLGSSPEATNGMNLAEFESRIEESADFGKAAFRALDVDRDGKLDAEPFSTIEHSLESQGSTGQDCRGNAIARTVIEDTLALTIINDADSPGHTCHLIDVLTEYAAGLQNIESKDPTPETRAAIKVFGEAFVLDETHQSTPCKGYTEAFLKATTDFKGVADLVSCISPTEDVDPSKCHAAMNAKAHIRDHKVWKEKKGRRKAAKKTAWQVNSVNAGISEKPVPSGPCYKSEAGDTGTDPLTGETLLCTEEDAKWLRYPNAGRYFSDKLVHAKGLFERNDNTGVARAFTECGAPFIAGPSGTMWTVLAMLDSRSDGLSCNRKGIAEMMQFAAQLVLGGHHSWSEICIAMQDAMHGCAEEHKVSFFFGVECAVTHDATCPGHDAEAQSERWPAMMSSLRTVWDEVGKDIEPESAANVDAYHLQHGHRAASLRQMDKFGHHHTHKHAHKQAHGGK